MAHPVLNQLVALLGPLLTPDFAARPAARQHQLASHPGEDGRWVQKPVALSADYLTFTRETVRGQAGWLTTVELSWTLPQPVTRQELEAALGPGRLVRGSHAEPTDRWDFWPRGTPLRGLVSVFVTAPGSPDRLEMRSILVHRIPPAGFVPAEAAAGKLVVLTDLGATRAQADPWPEPRFVWEKSDLDGLIRRLRPRFAARIPNRIEEDGPPIEVEFVPGRIDDFAPSNAPRLVPALGPVFELRGALREIRAGSLKREEARRQLRPEDLPAPFRKPWREITTRNGPPPDALLSELEPRLEAQARALLDDPGFAAFSGAWRQLAGWAAALDLRAGWRLEVYAAPAESALFLLQEGFLHEERCQPEGVAPRMLLVGAPLADAAFVQRMTTLLEPFELPVATALPADSGAADAVPPPALARVVRRVEHATALWLEAGRPAPVTLEAEVRSALEAACPGAASPELRLARAPQGPDRLEVRMEVAAPAPAPPIFFRYDANWHDYR